jgi:hypothetical protein
MSGLVNTATKVYNSTTPSGALICAVKGIVLDCTPPYVKYPALCAALLACGVATAATGNPLAASSFCTIGECILEETIK